MSFLPSGTTATILPEQVTTVNYAVGDNIRDPNTGIIFTCIQATTASATPPSEDPTNWIGQDSSTIGIIAPKGQMSDHDGWLKVDGRAISRTKYVRLFNAITEDIEANITSGSNSLRVEPEDIDKLGLGMAISGTGIPAGTTITALGSTHADVTGSTVGGQAIIHLDIGQTVTASLPVEIDNANFPDNTTITAYTASTTTANCKSVSGLFRLHEPTTGTKFTNISVGDTFTHSGFTGTQTVGSIPVTDPFTNSCRTNTNTSLFLPGNSTQEANIVVGQYVSGTGIPALTTISAITASQTAVNATFATTSANVFLPFGEYTSATYPIGRMVYHVNTASYITAAPTMVDTTKTGAFNVGTALFCCIVGQLPTSHVANTVLTHPGLPVGTVISSTSAEGTLTSNRSITGNTRLFFATGQSAPTVGQYMSHSGFPGTPRFTAYQADQTLSCGFISASPILKVPVGASIIVGQSLSGGGASGQISSIIAQVVTTGNTNTTITVSGIPSTTGLIVGQFVSGTGIPANCRIATIVNGTSITLSSAATSTVTGVTLTFGQIVTMSVNSSATSTFFAVIFGAYGTTDVTATSTVSGTTTFGGYITASSACTGSETTSINLGSRIILGANSTGAGSNVSLTLGAIYTLSATTTATSTNTIAFGAWLNCANSATSTATTTATFSGFLTVDQSATATAVSQTFSFGENFTMSVNATSTQDNGSFILYAYGEGDGSTTFNLPDDPSGRALGFSGAGSGLTARGVNAQAGTETHTLALTEIPAHTHTMRGTVSISEGIGSNDTVMDNAGSSEDTGSTGGGGAHNNLQPTAFLGYAYIYSGAA